MAKSVSLPSITKAGATASRANKQLKSAGALAAAKAQRASSGPGDEAEEMLPMLAGRRKYLGDCEAPRNVPLPLPFFTGHSFCLHGQGYDLKDSELLAMVGSLSKLNRVDEVNLSGNGLLTDRSLVPLLQQLDGSETVLASLRRLCLASCLRMSAASQRASVSLLKKAEGLRLLDLSHVQLSMQCQLPLCEAIGRHPNLRNVNMADTGLGGTCLSQECVSRLINGRKVESLDLSWNSFSTEVFKTLGEGLVDSYCIKSLSLANCSAVYGEGDPPISVFFEYLSRDRSLTSLDASMNRVDFRCSLILEDGLDTHAKLADLTLSGNPLGVLGMRSLLRMLARGWTGLMHISTEACYSGAPNEESESQDAQTFSYVNPGGKYVLNLARPYHRSLLRMLYKTAERFGLPNEQAFLNITTTQPPYQHPVKDSDGVWLVSTVGVLTLTFNVERAMEVALQGIDDADFPAVLEKHYALMRFMPGFKKVIPLFAKWKEVGDRMNEQRVVLDALAKDFNLTLPYLQVMFQESDYLGNDTICELLPCVPGDTASKYLTCMLPGKLPDFLYVHRTMYQLMVLNSANPTGHYKLKLENCCDYAVGERLLLLDRWEAAVDRRHNRVDTSSRGNRSHIRNEHYQARPLYLRYHSVAEWKLPEEGLFEFDYISNQRPLPDAEVLSDELWEKLLVDMNISPCSPEDRIGVLRAISHNFYLTSLHMRQLVGYFRTSELRSEAFVIFYLRIVDMHNAKLFRVRFGDVAEIVRLQERLGYASFFPFLQPENATFRLDLAFYDQRLCASMFVALSCKEKDSNVREFSLRNPDGTYDPMTKGLPRSWENPVELPPAGVFSGKYVCSPEDVKFDFRRSLSEKYGFFHVLPNSRDDVQWWTGLTEPPNDVIDLLEFFISRVNHVDEAFSLIDGPGGNGVVTLKEFREGLEEMGCEKFKGKDEGQRIATVFRYLDPGGEGSVSKDEFRILDQLWKELMLSIKEFVHFLILSFGDLLLAWDELDDDGSGELTLEEWMQAVEKVGYFGPSKVVFALLDSTDDGNISFDEFEVLEQYKPDQDHSRSASKK